MAKKTSEELIEKVIVNIDEDRKRLVELYSKIETVARSEADVLGLAAVSEHLVKIADSLTKQTAQLVELAKLRQKAEGIKPDIDGLSNEDYEELYNAIDSRESLKKDDWKGDA